jgi:hypothetical protein
MTHTARTSWKWRILLGGALLPTALASGCQSMNNTETGALAGGGIGALLGALAGGPRHAGVGALIGAGAGATAGALAGNAADKSEQKAAAAREAALRNPPLSLEDVARLTGSAASDDVIIGQIRSTGSVYFLTAEQIIWLQNNGVREPVIREMQATATRPRRVYTAVPVQPVYVVEPSPPPPPVGIGVGVTYVGGFRR